MSLRTWQQNMTTVIQPFQRDLQRGIPQSHRTMHTGRHAKCRTPRENQKHQNERTRNCPGFLRNTSPMQHSCSHHYNAFRSTTYTSMQPLQCDSHLRVAERQGRNRLYALKRSKPQPPHTEGTFHRRLQPLYTEKHTVSCPSFLPKTHPMSQQTWQQNMTAIMQPTSQVSTSLRHHFPRSLLP